MRRDPDAQETTRAAFYGGAGDEHADEFPPQVVAPRLTLRQRAGRLGLMGGLVAVALLIVLAGSFPSLRDRAMRAVIPPPTATFLAGSDRFYAAVDVPWTTVSINGQSLTLPRYDPLQAIPTQPPLRLGRGQYTLVWNAPPFKPQRCVLIVPVSVASTCKVNALTTETQGIVSLVTVDESLATLSPDDAAALTSAANAAFPSGGATVRPGELYAGYHTATTSLRARLRLVLDLHTTSGSACRVDIDNPAAGTCQARIDTCAALCTITDYSTLTGPGAPSGWLVAAPARLVWDYTTPGGQPVALDQPINPGGAGVGEHLVLMLVTWTEQGWQVELLFGGGLPDASINQLIVNPGCVAAKDDFANGTRYVQLRYASAGDPSYGCAIVATLTPGQDGLFLERFGTLLAVNDLAHQFIRPLPLADAYERTLAQQLLDRPIYSS